MNIKNHQREKKRNGMHGNILTLESLSQQNNHRHSIDIKERGFCTKTPKSYGFIFAHFFKFVSPPSSLKTIMLFFKTLDYYWNSQNVKKK